MYSFIVTATKPLHYTLTTLVCCKSVINSRVHVCLLKLYLRVIHLSGQNRACLEISKYTFVNVCYYRVFSDIHMYIIRFLCVYFPFQLNFIFIFYVITSSCHAEIECRYNLAAYILYPRWFIIGCWIVVNRRKSDIKRYLHNIHHEAYVLPPHIL